MGLFKNSLELIAEISKMEAGNTTKIINSKSVGVEFDTVLAGMEKLTPKELTYVPEAVNVHKNKRLDCYVVEMDDLAKYMISANISSFKEAVDNIAEAYSIDSSKIALCIDEASCKEACKKAKNEEVCKGCGNPKSKCTCESKCESYVADLALAEACGGNGKKESCETCTKKEGCTKEACKKAKAEACGKGAKCESYVEDLALAEACGGKGKKESCETCTKKEACKGKGKCGESCNSEGCKNEDADLADSLAILKDIMEQGIVVVKK